MLLIRTTQKWDDLWRGICWIWDIGMWPLLRRRLPEDSGSVPTSGWFVREFEKAGLSGHVIIRAADESVDRRNPKTDSEYSMGYALTRSLLEDGSRFTAIAGQNDMMAIGAVDALQDARLRVPKDVSVIGCDNIFYSGIRRVSLTTIDHFVDLKGRDACDIIIRKIDTGIRFGEGIRPTSVYNIEYNPKIIVRKTTGYARMDKPDPINEKSEENKFK